MAMAKKFAWIGIILGASAVAAEYQPLTRRTTVSVPSTPVNIKTVPSPLPPVDSGARKQPASTSGNSSADKEVDLPPPRKLPANVKDADGTELSAPRALTLQEELTKLRAERGALAAERASAQQFMNQGPVGGGNEELARLRLRAGELMTRFSLMEKKGRDKKGPPLEPVEPKPEKKPPREREPEPKPKDKAPTKPAEEPKPAKPTKPEEGHDAASADAVDAMALGETLFRTGSYADALNAYRKVNLKALPAETRLTTQYLMATCFRKVGKTDEAVKLYQDIVDTRGDDVVVECAQWQLNGIRWRQDLESQAAQLRQRRSNLEGDKP